MLTDEHAVETIFGFFQYPETVLDQGGSIVAESGLSRKWCFQNWIKTPDPRFRAIVKEFALAGYVASECDDYRQG